MPMKIAEHTATDFKMQEAAGPGGPGVAGRHPAGRATVDGPLTVEVAGSIAAVTKLRADYDHLDRTAGNSLPFTLFEWHVTWCRHFLNLDPDVADELSVLVLRNPSAACVAIVPLVFSHRRFGPLRVVSVNLLGADPSTTESRTPLIEPGYEALVARTVRAHLDGSADWDWISFGGITAQFGRTLAAGDAMEIQEEAPGYVLDLAPTWEQFRAGLKRNIRESLRHCYNSLSRDGHRFQFEVAREPRAVRLGLERFLELHAMRARMPGTIDHPDHFVSEVSRRFLFDVCEQLSTRDVVRVFLLRIGSEVVAARIGFVVGDSLCLYYSGFDPDWARYGVMTTTIAEAMKYAIGHGLTSVNLSRGTDTSKTRWGPRVIPYVVAVERRRRLVSRFAHHCYLSARSGKGLQYWLLARLGKARRVWS